MKRTLLTILITTVVTSFFWHLADSVIRGANKLWLISAVKVPGRMALDDITADMDAARYALAYRKLSELRREWAAFDHEPGFGGKAIGNIMVVFGRVDGQAETNKITETSMATNQSLPEVSETNRTSLAPGTGR